LTRWLALGVAVALVAVALTLVVTAPEEDIEPAAAGALVGPPTTDPCGAPVLRASGEPWLCSFADDFDGAGLDPDRWQPLTTAESGSRKSECRVDSPRHIAVRDGVLLLTAIRLPSPILCASTEGAHQTAQLAGAVTTNRLFAQAYGRVEIVAAMPEHRRDGFHGALWMYPQTPVYGAWPASGEIDIVEYRTGLADHPVPSVHWLEDGEHEIVTNYECTLPQPEEFHSYVLEWSAVGMRFLFDGAVCLSVRFDQLRHPGGRPYDRPFFLILNQSHGVGLNKATAGSPVSATMRVDSVKVWR